MTALRVGLALLVKNLSHHAIILLWASILYAATLLTAWSLTLIQTEDSVMGSGVGLLYYIGPLMVILINERLVARDMLDGTSEFLAALPMHGVLRAGVPFLLGLVLTLTLTEATLLSSALLAWRREGLPLGWFVQLHWQTWAYMFAWYAVSFAVAWLGRWRWLAWWALLVGAASLEGTWSQKPFRSLMWHAVLADPIDHARSLPPYDALPTTLLWAVGALFLAALLLSWRGGALPSSWYTPSNTRQRAMILLGAVLVLAAEPMLKATAPAPPPLGVAEAVPAERAVVRVSGGENLLPVAREAADLLDDLGELVGVSQWPEVTLYPSPRGLDRHVRRPPSSGTRLELLVDPDGPTSTLAREISSYVLQAQAGGLGLLVADLDSLALGAPGYLRPSQALQRRLSFVKDPGLPHLQLLNQSGRDATEAVAAARLEALGPAAPCVLRHALGVRRGSSLPSLLSARWDLREGWIERVCGASEPVLPLVTGQPGTPSVKIDVASDRLTALFSAPPEPGSVLRRQALDGLEHHPRPDDLWRLERVGGRDSVHVDYPLNQPVALELVRYDPAIEGWRSSGVEVR